jgi:hypothetical protein
MWFDIPGNVFSGRQAGYQGSDTKADLDNHSRQMNLHQASYQHQAGYQGTGTKADLDNHSQQLNPNNSKFQGKR